MPTLREQLMPEHRPYLDGLAGYIARQVRQALEDPDNRADFERWYFEQYGKDYIWKTE